MGQNGNPKGFSGCFHLSNNRGGYYHYDGNVQMMALDASLSNYKFGASNNIQPDSLRVYSVCRI